MCLCTANFVGEHIDFRSVRPLFVRPSHIRFTLVFKLFFYEDEVINKKMCLCDTDVQLSTIFLSETLNPHIFISSYHVYHVS
jgi:hypothetical protein